MSFKEYLLTLEWNSFETYPPQGENIFLHCTSDDGEIHRFLKIHCFNAVNFNVEKLTKTFQPNHRWLYTWLPTDAINYDND